MCNCECSLNKIVLKKAIGAKRYFFGQGRQIWHGSDSTDLKKKTGPAPWILLNTAPATAECYNKIQQKNNLIKFKLRNKPRNPFQNMFLIEIYSVSDPDPHHLAGFGSASWFKKT